MTNQLDHIRPVGTPGRVGQATAVEQSRAVAEVHAAVVVAQQCPRSVTAAIEAMQEACAQPALAGRAFFRFERGKDMRTGKPNIVTGPSVHLARELARCWGNVQHGITELSRDDGHGESEMQAWAWDVQTNTRSSNTFIVPHKRDTKNGVQQLTQMRDIYDNNANNGARRLREAIFSVLPTWYTEQARELCQQTNEKGGGKPLAQRITDAVKAFEKFRVSPARIAAKFSYASVDELTATDVAQLAVIYSSLNEGAVTVDDEFPAEAAGRLSAADITGQPPQNVPPAGEQPSPPPPAAEPASAPAGPAGGTQPRRASSGQVGMIRKKFGQLYPGEETPAERLERLTQTAILAGIDGLIGSTNELTSEQAARVRRWLDPCTTAAELEALVESGTVPGE